MASRGHRLNPEAAPSLSTCRLTWLAPQAARGASRKPRTSATSAQPRRAAPRCRQVSRGEERACVTCDTHRCARPVTQGARSRRGARPSPGAPRVAAWPRGRVSAETRHPRCSATPRHGAPRTTRSRLPYASPSALTVSRIDKLIPAGALTPRGARGSYRKNRLSAPGGGPPCQGEA
jgi:hypothetical protein